MFGTPVLAQHSLPQSSFPFFSSRLAFTRGTAWRSTISLPSAQTTRQALRSSRGWIRCDASADAKQSVLTATKLERATKVRAVMTVKPKAGEDLDEALSWWEKLLNIAMELDLVSAELDPSGKEKEPIERFVGKGRKEGDVMKYEVTFEVPKDFGEIGAVLVGNRHEEELYLVDIVLTTDDNTPAVTVDCRSWLAPESFSDQKRIFFTTKSYLPSETPKGLVNRRKQELEGLRGDGKGERVHYERIYDYDVYNDLGNPDKSPDLARPVLGGNKELPYPRRGRTGRPKTEKDPHSEEPALTPNDYYVPLDEELSEIKSVSVATGLARTREMIQSLLIHNPVYQNPTFPNFKSINQLYDDGVVIPEQKEFSSNMRFIKCSKHDTEALLQFDIPTLIENDSFSWLTDGEFSRQTLAGVNPLCIQLVTDFPFVSKLDPKIYGPSESAITEEIINEQIRGVMTAREALEQKRLFLLDYHDWLIPYVHKVRELKGTTLYGSRTLFFLTEEGTLTPLAIELTVPESPTKPQWKQVFTPSSDATGRWLWALAKTHAVSHDSTFHELVSHWLRTHCCTEPYVIAMKRQLSAVHPIFRLMHPYFLYTMDINSLRVLLISAGGIFESNFAPGKYTVELSSVAYRDQWRFDMEALPADLIRRGMAVEDPTADHGLRLTVEDYPYANDGLLVWFSIKEWVSAYVNHYYTSPTHVKEDYELQNWWTEVRTKGHADKKDEQWWPVLKTQDDLIQVLTTIIWVSSGQHAAVNFGQYAYAGYFPNRTTIARNKIPSEDYKSEEFARFFVKPDKELLDCLPSPTQAISVVATLYLLSTHSPDEEYLGREAEPAWIKDEAIHAAFKIFNGRINDIEGIIDARNITPQLQNRCGAGTVPYEGLKPFSPPGVTGKGVPNSISM